MLCVVLIILLNSEVEKTTCYNIPFLLRKIEESKKKQRKNCSLPSDIQWCSISCGVWDLRQARFIQ